MNTRKKKPHPNWRPFEEARTFACSLRLKNKTAWAEWAKSDARPDDIPSDPESRYEDKGWRGWGDWLGTGRIANQNRAYRSFQEARAFVRSLGLNSSHEWKTWLQQSNKPIDIPAYPDTLFHYAKKWNATCRNSE